MPVPGTRVAVVTGAAAGMGEAYLRGLAERGFRVVGLDRDAVGLQRLSGEIAATASDLLIAVADITCEAAVERAFRSVLSETGRIDVLVNNAGAAVSAAPLAGTGLAEWEADIRLNLTGHFLCIRAVLPKMLAAGAGSIINITSTSVFTGVTAHLHRSGSANFVPYVAAKAGVVGMTRALARELGPKGIRVNAVAPGFTPTQRVRAAFPQSAMDRMVADLSLPRLQQPDDAVGAVIFLASDESRFVTGQVIRVDGGGSMG